MSEGKEGMEGKRIGEIFAGSVVLVTGSTGFVGGVLLEKILRSCPQVSRVYLLIRKKGFTDVRQRLDSIFSLPLYSGHDVEALRKKVVALDGDVKQINLGLLDSDVQVLTESCNFVFHAAASTKFNSSLHEAVRDNLVGTDNVLQLVRRMTALKAFVYVSTAFCNCTSGDVIAEKVYPNQWEPSQIIELVNERSPEEIARNIRNIIGSHPNTYTFSKLLAENLIKSQSEHLPIAIVRPSIVGSTAESPIAGWVENVRSGLFPLLAGAGRGVFRTLPAVGHLVSDSVPVDMLASLIVTAAAAAATTRSFEVYHFTSGGRNPIKWSEYCRLAEEKFWEYPCYELVFYPRVKCRSNNLRNRIFSVWAHYLPAVFHDLLLRLQGQKPLVFKVQRMYSKGCGFIEPFLKREWRFGTSNTERLAEWLSPEDRREFRFDIRELDWSRYMASVVLGIREYYHKQSPDTLSRGVKHQRFWWLVEKAVWIFIFFACWSGLDILLGPSNLTLLLAGIFTLFYIWF